MSLVRFVHAADLHLDSPFTGLRRSAPEISRVLQNATFDAYANIIDLCISESVDALLIAGDIFDGADRSLRAQLRFIGGLSRLAAAGIRSFICHGNHDPLDGWEARLDLPHGCHRFGPNVERVPMFPDQPNRASIYGVSYPTRDVRYSLIPDFGSADPAVFSVGLLHANVNGNAAHEAYASCTVAELSATGIDYWALGHIHHRDILSQPVPWAVYPGNSQGRHPNERGARGVYLVDVSDSRQVSLEFRATDVVRWENIEIDIGGMSTQTLLNEIDNRLTETRDDAEGRPVIVRIALQGRGLAHHELRRTGALDDLVDDVNETWAGQRPFLWCNQITSSTGAPIDRAALLHGNDFIGDLLRLVDESLSTHDALHQFQGPLEDLYTNARARQYLRDSMPDDDTLRELIAEAEELCLAELIDEGAE